MNKKTIVILILIIVVIIAFFINISLRNKKNETQNNTQIAQQSENKMLEIKKIEGYEIFNANMLVERETTSFKACIRNTSKETKENRYFEISFLDDKQEALGKITVHIEKLEPNEIIEINVSIWENMQNAKDYKVVEK